MNQQDFYQAKLDFETDSWDLSEALNNGGDIIPFSCDNVSLAAEIW